LIASLVEAIKEQQKTLDKQEEKLNKQQEEIDRLILLLENKK